MASSADEIFQNGSEYFAQGRFSEALPLFRSMLTEREHTSRAHFQTGRCLHRMGHPHQGWPHLKIAWRELQTKQVADAAALCALEVGDTEALLDIIDVYVRMKSPSHKTIRLLFGAPDFAAWYRFWRLRQDELSRALGEHVEWASFLKDRGAIIDEFLAEAALPPKLSFSPTYPTCLDVLTDDALAELLRLSLHTHIHIRCTGWDFSKRLSGAAGTDLLLSELPVWLRGQVAGDGCRLVFDASGEAPRLSASDLDGAMLALTGRCEQQDIVCVLTANSRLPERSERMPVVLEFNSYPLAVTKAFRAISPSLAAQYLANTKESIHHFTMLTGMPRPHRIATMILLRRRGLLDQTNYSWWGDTNSKSSRSTEKYIALGKGLFAQLNVSQDELDWVRALPERVVAGDADAPVVSSTHYLCKSVDMTYMRSAPFHVVLETEFEQSHTLRMTEKSLKPILAGVPFITIAVPGMIAHLRDCGLDVLDDVIDHGYDEVLNGAERLQKVVEEMGRLVEVAVPQTRLAEMQEKNSHALGVWYEDTTERYTMSFMNWLKAPSGASA